MEETCSQITKMPTTSVISTADRGCTEPAPITPHVTLGRLSLRHYPLTKACYERGGDQGKA